jgi:malonyl-CoA O-methyltransferase
MGWPFTRKRAVTAERIDPQSAYSLWARDYPARPHNRLMEVEQDTVLALLPDISGLRVLDAGCGSGRYLRQLESRGARAFGIDLSEAMLGRARETTDRIARADLRALPFQATSIDLVVCGLALGDIAELDVALSEIARTLRPGGCMIYSVVHPGGEAAGWSRTFAVDGRQVVIDSHWHSLDRHRAACAAAGFDIEEWREPVLDELPQHRAVLVVRVRRNR